MALNYALPKRNPDQVIVLNTPAAADSVLATGVITLRDEAANTALKVRIADLIGRKKEAYTAGTAHVVDVDVTGASLVANSIYSLTVEIPNVVNKETNAVFVTRNYTVSVDATPTVGELQAAFVAAINADTANTNLTATAEAGDIVRITAGSALMGELRVTTNVSGVTVADQTAYVEPVGTPTEVAGYLPGDSASLASGTEYTRYTLRYRKAIAHNSVAGMKVFKEVDVFLYAEENGADYAAFATAIDAQLGGTATAANYLGAPAL